MKKYGFIRFISIFLVMSILLSLCACSTNNLQTQNSKTNNISLIDQAGRNISLDRPAERVVSCYYITSYAMMSLGIADKLVGIEDKADTRPIYQMCSPGLLKLPSVGTLKSCNVEKIVSLKPDIVLMPKKLLEYADTLDKLGVKVLVVDPETQETSQEMLNLIGKACNVEDKAKKLSDYREEKIARLQEKIKNTEKPKVYMCSVSSYMGTAPNGMYQNDLIVNSGGINVANQLSGTYWTQVSYESILAMNPEVMIIPMGASYPIEDLYKDEQLKNIDAIKNHRVYSMPSNFEEWDSPVPSNILGVLWLATMLHNDKYTTDEFKEDVKHFYETFYGFTPSKEQLDKIG